MYNKMNFCRFTSKIPRNPIGCGFEVNEIILIGDMTILLIILIGIGIFVLLGILGWGIQLLGFLGGLLGEGITGCIGCFIKFFWVILLIAIFIALIQ